MSPTPKTTWRRCGQHCGLEACCCTSATGQHVSLAQFVRGTTEGKEGYSIYRWIVFLHVYAAYAFMLVHGVYAAVMWKLRGEADPERSLTLFNVLPSLHLQRFLLALVVITGLIAGLMRPWWGQGWAWGLMRSWWREGWMWTSLVLLIVITIVMRRYGASYFGLVERAAMRAIEERKSASALPAGPDKFAAARATWHPIGLTVLGMAGLALILWLMMFKPF